MASERSPELRVAPVANWHNRQPGIIHQLMRQSPNAIPIGMSLLTIWWQGLQYTISNKLILFVASSLVSPTLLLLLIGKHKTVLNQWNHSALLAPDSSVQHGLQILQFYHYCCKAAVSFWIAGIAHKVKITA